MARVFFPVVLASAAALAGCALVTSFDGFTGGRAGDGGGGGGGGGSSGGASSGSSGGSGSGYCEAHAAGNTFCADFDESSVTTAWIEGVLQSQAVDKKNDVSLSAAPVISAPASIQATTGGGTGFADLEVNLTNGPNQVLHAELDLSPDNTKAMPVIEIDFCNVACNGAPPYDFELLINQAGGNTCIGEHGAGCTASLTQGGTPATQTWSHVTLDANMGTGAISVDVGGLQINGALTVPATLPSALLIFAFGIPSDSPGGSLHIDNVLFSAKASN